MSENATSSAMEEPYHDRPPLGHPARYHYGGNVTPVRFLGMHRAEPIVIFPDGRIEVVPRERVRVLSKAELP